MAQKFSTGDVVKFINKKRRSWTIGETHIIHECAYHGGGKFRYSTNLGAWFDDGDFELVESASTASFAQLDKDLAEED